MNKKGQAVMWLIAIAMITLATTGTLYFTGVIGTNVQPTKIATKDQTGSGAVGSSGSTGTTLTVTKYNKFIPAASASGTTRYSLNGQPWSTTAPGISPGDVISILVNGTQFHNSDVITKTVPQASTLLITVPMKSNASTAGSGGFTVFSTNNVALTNGGGAQNQTALGAGLPYTFQYRFDVGSNVATNPLRCILGANTTKVSTMGITGLPSSATVSGAGVPNWYTKMGPADLYWIVDTDSIEGTSGNAISQFGAISVNPTSGSSLANSRFVVDCYSKETFVDTNDPAGIVKTDITDYLNNQISKEHHKFTIYNK